MATSITSSKQIRSMQAIDILVSGKTDSELLNALVSCITDNDNDLLSALRANTNYNDKTNANIEVLAAIVNCVQDRMQSSTDNPF